MKAHTNAIQSIYLADEGSLIATASEKGTLIRLFDLQDEERFQEFRRGFDNSSLTMLS